MYFDSFLKISCLGDDELESVVAKLEKMSEVHKVDFILSVSYDENELPESVKKNIIVSL